MDYKTCRTCGTELEITKDNFYYRINSKGKYAFSSPDCRECYLERDRGYREKVKEEQYAGSDIVLLKPNKYVDHIQKEQTFKFLTLMGWKFNEERGIWYDNIKKTKDGEFIGVWKKKGKYNFTEETFEPLIFSSHDYTRDKSKDQLVQDMVKDYFLYGMKPKQVIEKYDVKEHYFEYYISKYRRQITQKSIQDTLSVKTRKSRYRETIEVIPKFRLCHKTLREKYTEEFIRQIQEDYFKHKMTYRDVLKKYSEHYTFAKYVIHKTMMLIKEKKNDKHST